MCTMHIWYNLRKIQTIFTFWPFRNDFSSVFMQRAHMYYSEKSDMYLMRSQSKAVSKNNISYELYRFTKGDRVKRVKNFRLSCIYNQNFVTSITLRYKKSMVFFTKMCIFSLKVPFSMTRVAKRVYFHNSLGRHVAD